jgi:hypothetical protein
MKRDFLVVYDYGQGGIWAMVRAQSKRQIEQRFPELRVHLRRPGWMTADYEESIRRRSSLDIDQPRGLLAQLLSNREKDKPRAAS